MESIHLHRNSLRKLTSGAGFTLVELMVVLAIIVVISGIVLSSQSSFNKSLILANTAYDIGLTLRSAQTFGLSSRAAAADASVGYGLHFQTGTTDSYILFADTAGGTSCAGMPPDCKPGDHVYTSGVDAPPVQTYELGNNMRVSDFCALSGGSWSCSAGGGLSSLDIVFARPNPDPFMSANGSYSPVFPVTKACITITSSQGGARFITVAESGQIIANAASCP